MNTIPAAIDPVKLDRLAEVAIKVGLQLQPGQDLFLTAPASALPLVRRIVEHAYKAGAGLVTPMLSDEEITLARYRFGRDDSFDRAPSWLYDGVAKAFDANTARLAVVGDDPGVGASGQPRGADGLAAVPRGSAPRRARARARGRRRRGERRLG